MADHPARDWPVLACVAAGGAAGALARHGVNVLAGPLLATFAVNVTGCVAIGVLMGGPWTRRSRLVRPFLGVGVLGGYTTFSAYVLDFRVAVGDGRAGVAVLYLAGTLVCALLGVWAGLAAARKVWR